MSTNFRPLERIRIVSLALNLPGPAALMRCRRMGATCIKIEPPAGDPMGWYNKVAYAEMHEGVKVVQADLKTGEGQRAVHAELAKADVLLTSFRPSALAKLGLDWNSLHSRYPVLSQVAIVGAPGERAEEPGHDLTYLADNGLVPGMELPATLYADMGGSLMASEAVLQAAVRRLEPYGGSGDPHPQGVYIEVALSEAAGYLATPRRWGLTQPTGSVGGAHAGYRVYKCKDGRAAVAALEPHFAAGLCAAAGVEMKDARQTMFEPSTHEAIKAFFAANTCDELDRLARERDLPIHTMRD
ncbi:CoA transferase [Ramlibacter albus]|uniref:CoA transferase n=1 Tax=Ramlibacter albus TaxID=2079448 RepID=A0A923M7M4_9BURK|nr:CoA transferase [Ramlibacter albus]MBC5764289.1 CoA transferase [Ramlibacter albus]